MKHELKQRPIRRRLALLCEFLFDASVLLLFIAQAFIAACLIVYGYLPIPQKWGDELVSKSLPKGLIATTQAYQLRLDGHIHVSGLEIRAEHIKQPLFTAAGAELKFQVLDKDGALALKPTALILSEGRLYTPSIYSPSGEYTPILDRIAFRLDLSTGQARIDRFAALLDNIRLRGSIDIPTIAKRAHTNVAFKDQLAEFYSKVALLSNYKEHIEDFETPTVLFRFTADTAADLQATQIKISSQSYQNSEASARRILLQGDFELKQNTLSPRSPVVVQAKNISIPRYNIEAEQLVAQIEPDQWANILTGELPRVSIAANELSIQDFELEGPMLSIDPSALPILGFSGLASSLDGAIQLKGNLDTSNWSGDVRAKGSIDLLQIAPTAIVEKLPAIEFERSPYLDLRITFEEGFEIKDAKLLAQVEQIKIDQLIFDHIHAHASFKDGQIHIDRMYLRRDWQWLDLLFSLDTELKDYKVTLRGTAIPYEYNSILPRWWEAIFRDFDFSDVKDGLGDFIIYGNTNNRAVDLFYGHAQAKDVSYKGVLVKEGELIVRGRGPYSEIHQLRVSGEQGWATGNIKFTSKLDDIKAPLCVRLDFDTELSLTDAEKLFPGKIAEIIRDFKTEGLPHTKLEGAIFHKAYPEYAGKSYFDLTANSEEAISFKGVALSQLNFKLYGRPAVTHLREMNFVYANGKGTGAIDILTPENEMPILRYDVSLKDADQNSAIEGLPQLDDLEDSLETKVTDNSLREDARISLEIKGTGPITNHYQHEGRGNFVINNKKLGKIQLLGPLSKFLQNTYLSFTSFELNIMQGTFSYLNDEVNFDSLRIDGPRTKINAPGTMQLSDQSIKMKVKVNLFGNAGNPESGIRKIGDLITKPIPNLLQFELTGTVQNQKLRSLYDPRNFIPLF